MLTLAGIVAALIAAAVFVAYVVEPWIKRRR